jgi:hypothetical protein
MTVSSPPPQKGWRYFDWWAWKPKRKYVKKSSLAADDVVPPKPKRKYVKKSSLAADVVPPKLQ